MITINEFKTKYNIASSDTVKKWISKGYIPGVKAVDGKYQIPDEARPPYTDARATKPDSINLSILTGITKRLQVVPELYGISKSDFDLYIQGLEKAGLIQVFESDGVSYYNATIKGEEKVKESKYKLWKLVCSVLPVLKDLI